MRVDGWLKDGGRGGGSFVNGTERLDFEGDGLAGQGLHEDLHASAQTENGGTAVFKVLDSKDEVLLVGRDAGGCSSHPIVS